MRIIEIHHRENYNNMTYEFLIVLLGIRFRKVLTHEQMVIDPKKPLWFTFSKWLQIKTCSHAWEKYGLPRMVGYFLGDAPVDMIQESKCKICGKEDSYRYYSGVDTSY